MSTLSLNIERECKICGNVFKAKTLDSFYCSPKCSKVAWKRRHDADIYAERIRKVAEQKGDLSAYISVAEAIRLYDVGRSTLYRLVKSGKIPSVIIGTRTVRIDRAELEKILEPLEQVQGPRLYNMEPDNCGLLVILQAAETLVLRYWSNCRLRFAPQSLMYELNLLTSHCSLKHSGALLGSNSMRNRTAR